MIYYSPKEHTYDNNIYLTLWVQGTNLKNYNDFDNEAITFSRLLGKNQVFRAIKLF